MNRDHTSIPSARRTLLEIFFLSLLIAGGLLTVYTLGRAWGQPGSGSEAVSVTPAPSPSPASAPVPDLESNPGGFFEQTFAAAQSGDWTMVAALILIAAVWVARKPWALGKISFFTTDRGGVVMAFGLSVIGGLSHAIIAIGKFPTDLATYKAIGMTAVTAMGGYAALKRLVWPADKKKSDPDVGKTSDNP